MGEAVAARPAPGTGAAGGALSRHRRAHGRAVRLRLERDAPVIWKADHVVRGFQTRVQRVERIADERLGGEAGPLQA